MNAMASMMYVWVAFALTFSILSIQILLALKRYKSTYRSLKRSQSQNVSVF